MVPRRGGWRPLLRGGLRARAIEVVRSIAESLDGPRGRLSEEGASQASLATGTAGLAILFGYLARSRVPGRGHARMLGLLDESAGFVESHATDVSLYGGFTGVAWAMAHLVPGPATGDDDPLTRIDEEVRSAAGRPWTGEYDLINGLVGLGVYSLERLPRPTAVESLKRIVASLAGSAEAIGGGLTWRTPANRLPAWQQALYPDGYVNLGLAHGVPGVVSLLGQIVAAGIAKARARELLEGAVSWLLRSPHGPGASRFSPWIAPALPPEDCRSAWCYGDPGVAAALLVAARCAGERAWERTALSIALEAAARPAGETGALDAGLCHGAAGLAHVYNRIYQATGNVEVRRAATSWFERTLEMRQPGTGCGGYSAAVPGAGGTVRRRADPCFLTGSAGIALALLAAAAGREPAWDRVLLLSSAAADGVLRARPEPRRSAARKRASRLSRLARGPARTRRS